MGFSRSRACWQGAVGPAPWFVRLLAVSTVIPTEAPARALFHACELEVTWSA